MPACHNWKIGIDFWKWGPYKVRSLVSNSVYAEKNRNDPPSANQIISTAEPRCNHAVCTLWVHAPTSPYPALSAEAEPISKRHCRKWHHEAESLMMLIGAMGPKRLADLRLERDEKLSTWYFWCPRWFNFMRTFCWNVSVTVSSNFDVKNSTSDWPLHLEPLYVWHKGGLGEAKQVRASW